MTRNNILALILLTLAACDQQPEPEAGYMWQPLPCDVVEEVTYTVVDDHPRANTRTTTTTVTSAVVSIVDADPASVTARAQAADGVFIYFDAGTDVVTGLPDGTARVLCSETHITSTAIEVTGSPTAIATGEPVTDTFVEGGDYAIAR